MAKTTDPEARITRITLCGVQGCCPTVDVDRDAQKVAISDDNGGKVELSFAEMRELQQVKLDQ